MPRTRSILWSQLKLGVIGIIAVLLLTVAVVAVGGQGGFPWNRYSLKTRFADARDLKPGAVVRLNGKEVGKIITVEFSGADLEGGLSGVQVRPGLITTGRRPRSGR
jgi:ABC-type transporter Mla subunit MlaD